MPPMRKLNILLTHLAPILPTQRVLIHAVVAAPHVHDDLVYAGYCCLEILLVGERGPLAPADPVAHEGAE